MLKEKQFKAAYFARTGDRAFCARCEKTVGLFRLDEAAARYATAIGEIAALSEKGCLHTIDNGLGEILICRDSLSEEFSRRQTEELDADLLPRLV